MSDTSKEAVYKRARLGEPIGWGKRPALIVVDFQKGFTMPEAPMGGDMTAEVENARRLADACRRKNIKCIYTRVGYNKDGSDLSVWALKAPGLKEYTRDHWYYEFDERLGIQEEDILIEKHGPSALLGTHIVQMLIGMNIDTVILCGCTVGGCLYATAIDALSYNFRAMIATDASSDRAEETKKFFMWNMGMKYGDLLTTEEIIQHINSMEPMEYSTLY